MGYRGGGNEGAPNIGVINDVNVPLFLGVQYDGTPVSGISPFVEVYRVSDDYVADFAINTFVAPGTATSGSVFLTEVPSDEGLYKYLFNPFDFNQFEARQLYYAKYTAVVPSGFKDDVLTDIELITSEVQGFSNFSASGVFAVGQNPESMNVTFNDDRPC